MSDTILIAEDDPVYRSFIREAIAESELPQMKVEEAADGGAAVRLVKQLRAKYVVLDLQMPVMSGVEAARQIWFHDPSICILFWSNFADESYVRGLARIVPPEASYGYLLKSSSSSRLRGALEGVFLDGHCIIDREIRGIQARAEKWSETLSNAEYDMLVDISLGLTDLAIAGRHGLSTRGVQSRLQKLYTKLGVNAQDADDGEAIFNPRSRAVCVAVLRGIINAELIGLRQQQEAAGSAV
jgi:Response regulator containing a CheY-like receiver domain and an HTH DNA-binding domain